MYKESLNFLINNLNKTQFNQIFIKKIVNNLYLRHFYTTVNYIYNLILSKKILFLKMLMFNVLFFFSYKRRYFKI